MTTSGIRPPWWSYVLFGTAFGWLLSRSGAADYDYIQRMLLVESFQLYGVMCTAVAIAMPGIWFLKRRARTVFGTPLAVRPKPEHLGNVVGGVLFGIGWSISGMCPGPIFVNIGEGKVYALATLAGVLVGTSAFGLLYGTLTGPLRLPPIRERGH